MLDIIWGGHMCIKIPYHRPWILFLKTITSGGEGKGSYCHVCHVYMILACNNNNNNNNCLKSNIQ